MVTLVFWNQRKTGRKSNTFFKGDGRALSKDIQDAHVLLNHSMADQLQRPNSQDTGGTCSSLGEGRYERKF